MYEEHCLIEGAVALSVWQDADAVSHVFFLVDPGGTMIMYGKVHTRT